MVNPNLSNQQNSQEKNDWDNLGDVEFSPIDFPTDNVSTIKTAPDPMGEGRQDKRVDITDSTGKEKRTSNLMLGYNKRGVQIAEKYYSLEKLDEKLYEYLESDEDDVDYYVRRDAEGEKIFYEPSAVVDDIEQRIASATGPQIELSSSTKITNQDARILEAGKPDGETQLGVLMLGNTELEMPNGTYVSAEIVENALNNYLKAVKKQRPPMPPTPPIPPDNPNFPNEPVSVSGEKAEEIEDRTYRVIKRFKEASSKWIPLATVTAALIVSMLLPIQAQEVHAAQEDLDYQVSTPTEEVYQTEMTDEEKMQEVTNNLYDEIETGGEIEVPKGVAYLESSDNNPNANNRGVFGEEMRDAGEYTVDYISVLGKDGEIKKVEYDQGKNLGEFVNGVAEQEGVPAEDLTIMVHIGGPVSGWVDIADLAKKNVEITESTDSSAFIKEVVVSKDEQITGSEENFDGKISFSDEQGQTVEVNLMKADGTMAEVGDMVIGSDGREYRVENLDITAHETNEKQLTWGLADAAKVLALAGGAAVALSAMFGKRKRKEMVNMTEDEIRNLIRMQEENHQEEETSFEDDVETLLKEKEIEGLNGSAEEKLRQALIEKKITVEDIEKLNNIGETNGD